MDGKGTWRENIFIELFWRSVKYEGIYLRAYEIVSDARRHLERYISLYNARTVHSTSRRRMACTSMQ